MTISITKQVTCCDDIMTAVQPPLIYLLLVATFNVCKKIGCAKPYEQLIST